MDQLSSSAGRNHSETTAPLRFDVSNLDSSQAIELMVHGHLDRDGFVVLELGILRLVAMRQPVELRIDLGDTTGDLSDIDDPFAAIHDAMSDLGGVLIADRSNPSGA